MGCYALLCSAVRWDAMGYLADGRGTERKEGKKEGRKEGRKSGRKVRLH